MQNIGACCISKPTKCVLLLMTFILRKETTLDFLVNMEFIFVKTLYVTS